MNVAKGTVLLMGGSGFLGKLIGMHLTEQGYQVNCVALESPDDFISLGYPCRYFQWDGESPLPNDALHGEHDEVSIIINLAGDPLGSDRWLPGKRRAILESRIRAVEVAVDAADRCRAATMIQASSVDYYGDRGGSEATETTDVGRGFWPETIARWERAASTLNANTRLVILRMGEVFSIFGGSFRHRLEPYSYHLGAPFTGSDSFINWIHGDDLARLVQNIIENVSWEGPVNATAPKPCSQLELHQQFLHYFPTFIRIPVPLWAKRIAFGKEMDKAALNTKALPDKTQATGFTFHYPAISHCLKALLDRSSPDCFYYTRNQWLPAPPNEVWDFFAESKNWEKINPPMFRLQTNSDTLKFAEEGRNFKYTLHFLNMIPSVWCLRYTHLKRGKIMKGLVQDGQMHMLELGQTYTAVAGGTRIDDIMRYQFSQGMTFIPFILTVARFCNSTIFNYRQQALAKIFAQESGIKKAG